MTLFSMKNVTQKIKVEFQDKGSKVHFLPCPRMLHLVPPNKNKLQSSLVFSNLEKALISCSNTRYKNIFIGVFKHWTYTVLKLNEPQG